MKPALASLFLVLVAVVVSASDNKDDALTPTGIPATSGIPFSTLSFDTTAALPSALSALSSLISSQSTAIIVTSRVPESYTSSSSTQTSPTSGTPSVTFVASSSTSTSTSGARRSRSSVGGGTATSVGFVLGAIAALMC